MKDLCRLCLIPGNGLDIFKNKLDKVIEECFGIKVMMLENWPSHACSTCVNYLYGLEEFQVKIETSHKFFTKMESHAIDEAREMLTMETCGKEAEEVYEENIEVRSKRKSNRSKEKPKLKTPIKTARKYSKKRSKSPSIVPEQDTSDTSDIEQSPGPSNSKAAKSEDENSTYDPLQVEVGVAIKASTSGTDDDKETLDKLIKELNLLQCQKCAYQADSLRTLDVHFQAVHSCRVQVMCCNQNLRMYDIYDHMEYHLDNTAFRCGQCNTNCMSRKLYHNHVKGHGNQTYICEICGKELALKSYKSHVKTHQPSKTTKCDICGKHYFDILQHKTDIHGPRIRVKCDLCERVVLKTYMKVHVKRYHTNSNEHKCNACEGKVFATLKSLTNHINNIHLGIKYDCYFCRYRATTKANLIIHMKKQHTEEYLAFENEERIKRDLLLSEPRVKFKK